MQAEDRYCAPEHVLQVVQLPPARYFPPLQLVHVAAPAPEQVAQAALHAEQTPPLRYLPSAQPVHWFAPGPEHDVQLASHGLGGRAATSAGIS